MNHKYEVLFTKDLSIFKLTSENRPLTRLGVDRLKPDMSKFGFRRENPIYVNENFEVIRGQHRLTAARELGIGVWYSHTSLTMGDESIIPGDVSWTMVDHLHSASARGDSNAKWLLSLGKNVTKALVFVYGAWWLKARRTGDFSIPDHKKTELTKLLSIVADFEILLGDKEVRTREFFAACTSLVRSRSYDHALMLRKLESYPGIWERQINAKKYREQMELVHNYRQKNKIRLFESMDRT